MSCRGALCQNHDSGGNLATLLQMLDLARPWPLSSQPGKETGQAVPAQGGFKDQWLQGASCNYFTLSHTTLGWQSLGSPHNSQTSRP